MKTLSQLRLFFIIYFITKTAIEILLININKDEIMRMMQGFPISSDSIMVVVIIINILMFAIGLWLFYHLIQLKNWARIILLIIGWIVIINFIFTSLISSTAVDELSGMESTVDWNAIMMMDQITEVIGLLFWAAVIYFLMFNNKIKELFKGSSEADYSTTV